MAVLNSKKILQEKNTSDPSSVTSLTLTHKALSDVSCLSEFKNLERLDLSFNNLTSLEGLKLCVNLKWLSVVQNKLQSLKGIEGLTKLTVLNAGKNKLKSMDEVKSLVSLRALILNENEIISVCKLDQMTELNTLVLSRNPISSLGDSLINLKSMTKLSLSNCQLQSIGSSLKSCLELKELRLAHNEIDIIPSELEHLVKLQNLDMGNNLITRWSSLKVLASMVNLRNLNLKGNPVAEKDSILKKVKKLSPNLQIFNAKPIDKISAKGVPEKDNDSVETNKELAGTSDTETDNSFRNKTSEKDHSLDDFNDDADLRTEKKRKKAQDDRSVCISENANASEKRMDKKLKLQQNEDKLTADTETLNVNPAGEKKSKHKKNDRNNNLGGVGTDNELDKKSRKKIKGDKAIDSAEIPFTDLFAAATETADKELHHKTNQNLDAISGLVTHPKKKKKNRTAVNPAALESSLINEIGLGGPSAWCDS